MNGVSLSRLLSRKQYNPPESKSYDLLFAFKSRRKRHLVLLKLRTYQLVLMLGIK
jgi:hypothetical protein